MGSITKNEHTLARQVGGIDRARIPDRMAVVFQIGGHFHARQRRHFFHEVACGAHANRYGFGEGLVELTLEPQSSGVGHFGVEHHIERGQGDVLQVSHTGVQGGHHIHLDAHVFQQLGDFFHVIAVAKAQSRGPQDVAAGRLRLAVKALGW